MRFFARVGGDAAMRYVIVVAARSNPSVQAFPTPPFAKCAKDGAPAVLVTAARSKARATRPNFNHVRCTPKTSSLP